MKLVKFCLTTLHSSVLGKVRELGGVVQFAFGFYTPLSDSSVRCFWILDFEKPNNTEKTHKAAAQLNNESVFWQKILTGTTVNWINKRRDIKLFYPSHIHYSILIIVLYHKICTCIAASIKYRGKLYTTEAAAHLFQKLTALWKPNSHYFIQWGKQAVHSYLFTAVSLY